jgi:micrococcal nuclease
MGELRRAEAVQMGQGRSVRVRLLALALAVVMLAPLAAGPATRVGASAAVPAGIPKSAVPAEVVDQIDGAGIKVILAGEQVDIHLIGLDVSRRSGGPKPGECYGDEAFARLREILPQGTTVYLESDKKTHDDDTFLRYVWLPGSDDGKAALINTKMVREGYAAFKSDGVNTRYDDNLKAQEATAKKDKRGLWGVCGDVHQRIIPPPTPAPSVEEIKAQYTPLAVVRELAIRPGGMIGQKIYFYGTIRTIHVASPGMITVLGDSDPEGYAAAMQVQVAAPDGSTEWVFIGFDGDTTGMFEGSYVLVYGTVVDTQTGTNMFGGTISQPLVSAKYVELQ